MLVLCSTGIGGSLDYTTHILPFCAGIVDRQNVHALQTCSLQNQAGRYLQGCQNALECHVLELAILPSFAFVIRKQDLVAEQCNHQVCFVRNLCHPTDYTHSTCSRAWGPLKGSVRHGRAGYPAVSTRRASCHAGYRLIKMLARISYRTGDQY